ncbi:AAA family ATPase [Pseudonocardia sp. HH130630-07]|uniref:MinD/ParA family ATP-binding protein n=1 Tax=Pseudonocardia sp. HH130630-07 TaxID=1690815 RepID=UPI000A8F2753
MSENGAGEQPDGSVGRYVRERWSAADNAGRSFGRRRRTGGEDPAPAAGPAAPARGERPPPSAAERAASAPAPGRAGVGTQTPPSGSAWGSELPEVDDELVDEIDPRTPPHGLDLSAVRAAGETRAELPPSPEGSDDGRHRAAEPDPRPGDHGPGDHGPDDTGLYRSGGGDPESWWGTPSEEYPDDPDGEVIWRRPDPADPQPYGDGASGPGERTTPIGGGPDSRSVPYDDPGTPVSGDDGPAERAGVSPDGPAPTGPARPAGAAHSDEEPTVRTAAAVRGASPSRPADGPRPADGARQADGSGSADGTSPADRTSSADRTGPADGARPADGTGGADGTGPAHGARPADTVRSGDAPADRTRPAEAAGTVRPGDAPRPAAGHGRTDGPARTGRPAADRPWRTSWDRDAAERDASERASRSRPRAAEQARPDPEPAPRRPRWTAPEAVEARAAQHRRGSDGKHGGLDLTPSRSARASRPPASGWRRWVHLLTGGLVDPGESPAELHRRDLVSRLNRPLVSSHKIAMLSLKGGVGKTTVTATLGSTFAAHRGDRVVAVDANPDRGTLSQKIPLETTATVRHLLRDADKVRRYSDVRAYTSQGVSRLEVLASEQDPAVSEAFSEEDYRRAVDLLEHFYNLVLTDCGTGLMHSAMYGVLGMADQIVIVSSGSIDGARSASATLDWLDAHGYGALVRNAVVVINSVYRRAGGGVDLDRVAEHFAGRCRAVVRLPFDPHLEEGAEIDLDRLEEPTRIALLELAAAVADGFPV